MGKCFSKTRNLRNITITVLGVDNAGKTTVIKLLRKTSTDEVAPTVGFCTYELKWKKFLVTLYDVGGGPRIRGIWRNYLAESHALIYVVDASDQERLPETSDEFAKLVSDSRVQEKPILLLLNKQDLVGAIDDVQAADRMHLEQLVNENRCPCRVETISAIQKNAKNRQDSGLTDGFNWLLRSIDDNYPQIVTKVARDMRIQTEQLVKEKQEREERIRRMQEERDDKQTDIDADNQVSNGEPKTQSDADGIEMQNMNAERIDSTSATTTEPPNQSVANSVQINGHVRPHSGKRSSTPLITTATLSSSLATSMVPHLPPISPKQSSANLFKRSISPEHGIMIDSEPVSSTSAASRPTYVVQERRSSPRVYPDKMNDLGNSESSDHYKPRKRLRRRLSRFNKTAPTKQPETADETNETMQASERHRTTSPKTNGSFRKKPSPDSDKAMLEIAPFP